MSTSCSEITGSIPTSSGAPRAPGERCSHEQADEQRRCNPEGQYGNDGRKPILVDCHPGLPILVHVNGADDARWEPGALGSRRGVLVHPHAVSRRYLSRGLTGAGVVGRRVSHRVEGDEQCSRRNDAHEWQHHQEPHHRAGTEHPSGLLSGHPSSFRRLEVARLHPGEEMMRRMRVGGAHRPRPTLAAPPRPHGPGSAARRRVRGCAQRTSPSEALRTRLFIASVVARP